MILWLALGLLAVAIAALVARPLLRRATPLATAADADLAIYRDQLAELARDAERGLIGAAELAAARTEVERRLLAAADRARVEAPAEAPVRRAPLAAAALVLAVAGGGLAVYAQLGSPAVPDRPLAARLDPEQARRLAALAATARSSLDDASAWLAYGQALAEAGAAGEAAAVLARAASLAPEDARMQVAAAEALIALADLREGVPEPAQAMLRRALALEPDQPQALWFLGIAAAQARAPDEAARYWTRLLDRLPPDSAESRAVAAALEAIGRPVAGRP